MNVKVFIILLVLLALLFIAGLGLGLGQEGGLSGGGGFDAWQERMGRFGDLIPRGEVSLDDVRRAEPAACLAGETIRVPAGGFCALTLPPARGGRDWTLRLVTGGEAELALVQPVNREGEPITTRERLLAGGEVTLDVFRRQSEEDVITLTVVCSALGDDCALRTGSP